MGFKNVFIYIIIALGLLGFVYLMTDFDSKKEKRYLPIFGVDSVTSSNDTIWHQVGSFSFINQNNEVINENNLKNKIYVADFFFTRCPGICKDMAKQMRRVYRAYENDSNIAIISHTVDPEYDSINILKAYAEMQGVKDDKKWIFVTGDKKQLYDVARSQYYATATQGDGGAEDFVHTERFILVDKQKRIRGFYDGTSEAEVNKLLFDIEQLKKEDPNK